METAAKKKNSLALVAIASMFAWVSTCLLSSAAIASSVAPNRLDSMASSASTTMLTMAPSIEPTTTTTASTHHVVGSKTRAEIFLGVSLKSVGLVDASPANATRYYDALEEVALECTVAPKGPVNIFGRPQVTSPGHAQKIFNMATDMANSGSYKSVYMHSKWSTILERTGVKVNPNRLPDIAGIRLDCKIDMIEIASRTDDLTKLLERNKAIWNQLPAHLRGDIIIIDQLGNWTNVFP